MKRTTKTITKGAFRSLLCMSAVAAGIAAVSIVPAYAATVGTAATWVQNVNVTLTARISGGLATKINNKEILAAFVGGASVSTNGTTGPSTNTVIVSIPSTDTLVTNPPVLATNYFPQNATNGGIFATNGALVFSNFPGTITATNIIVTVGTNSTTNTVTLEETTNNPPTYTFTNFITVTTTNSTNTGHIFTGAFAGGVTNFATGTNADYITAVLTTNSSTNGLVWSFEASYLTNIVTGSTSNSGTVTVTAVKGDSLVLVTVLPPAGTTPYLASSTPPVFALKHPVKGSIPVLTDLSAFIHFTAFPTNVSSGGTTTITSYGLVSLDARIDSGATPAPISLISQAFFKETDKNNTKAGGFVPTGISTTDIGYGTFSGNGVVFEGTVNATGGSTSTSVLIEP